MSSYAPAVAQLASDCEPEGLTEANSERIAAELARIFHVSKGEVGILRIEDDALLFVHPSKLQNVGRIPLTTTTSIAARTANTRKAEIINNVVRTRHASFFEMVSVDGDGEPRRAREQQVIQKLMSAPVISMNKAVGVIQICRKGPTAPAAGPDFLPGDLQKLVMIANGLGKCFK